MTFSLVRAWIALPLHGITRTTLGLPLLLTALPAPLVTFLATIECVLAFLSCNKHCPLCHAYNNKDMCNEHMLHVCPVTAAPALPSPDELHPVCKIAVMSHVPCMTYMLTRITPASALLLQAAPLAPPDVWFQLLAALSNCDQKSDEACD